MSVNKVILVGNVGKQPEIRTTQDGRKIASFSIATSDKWKDRDGKFREKTEWHRIVVLSEGLVSIIEKYLKKGNRIYIEGMLQTRRWTDKENIERFSTEVILQGFNNKMEILEKAPKRPGEEGEDGDSEAEAGYTEIENFETEDFYTK